MFTYYFYTSFTLGKGFAEVEFKDGKILPASGILPEIKSDFFNGGVEVILRKTSQFGFFVVKGIDYVNLKKRVDEQGRKVFINFAIQCDIQEYDALCHLAANYINDRSYVENYIGKLFVIPFDNDYRYTIEQEKWDKLIQYLSESSINSTSKIVKQIAGKHEDDIRFIVCSRDFNYYAEQASDLNKAVKAQPLVSPTIGVVIENSSLLAKVPIRVFDKKGGETEDFLAFVSDVENFVIPMPAKSIDDDSIDTVSEVKNIETANEKKDISHNDKEKVDSPVSTGQSIVEISGCNNRSHIKLSQNQKKALVGIAVIVLFSIILVSKCNSSKADNNHGKNSIEQVDKR